MKGHGAKSYKLCMIAKDRGDIDNIVCYVDADREHGSSKSLLDFIFFNIEFYSGWC